MYSDLSDPKIQNISRYKEAISPTDIELIKLYNSITKCFLISAVILELESRDFQI